MALLTLETECPNQTARLFLTWTDLTRKTQNRKPNAPNAAKPSTANTTVPR